ncbi:MAG: transposase [Candidatus Omnitrophota bacterium]
MARPLRIEYAGAFYHIIQRGNERSNIFRADEDNDKFLEYIGIVCRRYNIFLHSFCLMDNHYHLILETKEANLTKAMHFLNASYAIYFNTKNKRAGHLFQGRYKAILVQADEYLHQLSKYIHLNPVRIKRVKDPAEYHWSSCKFFTGDIKEPFWLNVKFILSMFDANIKKAKIGYRNFVVDNMGKEADIIKNNISGGLILGNKDFVEKIKDKYIKDELREIPYIESLRGRPSLTDIQVKVKEDIKDEKLSRKIAIYLSRRYAGKSLNEISEFYEKLSYTGVSQLCIRLERDRKKNKQLDQIIKKIEKKINVECEDITP